MPLSDPRFEFSPTPIHSLEAGHTVQLADLPAFGVCGRSGSGRTTLIEAVIPKLRRQGLKVAVVKGTTDEIAVDSPDLASSIRRLSAHHDLVLVESNHYSLLPRVWLADASEKAVPTNVQGVVAHLSRDCDRVQSLLSILKEWLPLQWDKTPVFGCLLIGGKSRRMGYPKHLIQKNGKPWIQRPVELLEQTASQVAIVGGESEMAGCCPSTRCTHPWRTHGGGFGRPALGPPGLLAGGGLRSAPAVAALSGVAHLDSISRCLGDPSAATGTGPAHRASSGPL